ncbi:hypothetical protein HYX16_05900 [Candidatus Woesearchaeota archaeon]|nr:hypothetical protein [Candidatus Woesearchaeota archaeon]
MREDRITINYDGSMFKVYVLDKIESSYLDGLSKVVQFLKSIRNPNLLSVKPDYVDVDKDAEEIFEGVRYRILEELVKVS